MSAIQMMNFTYMAVTFLLICIETAEIWSDANDDDDDDVEEILIFYEVIAATDTLFLIMFMKQYPWVHYATHDTRLTQNIASGGRF